MKKQKIATWVQVYIAAAFHTILIGLSVFPGHDSGAPIIGALFGGIAYIIFLIVTMILNKYNVPWRVFLVFFLGTVLQLVLNIAEVIPPDGGFLSGIGQAIYCILLIIATGLFGFINLIVFVIRRICTRRSCNTQINNTPIVYESTFDGCRTDI